MRGLLPGTGLIAAVLALSVAACSILPSESRPPAPTTVVAGETDTPPPSLEATPAPTESPVVEPSPAASEPPLTGIVPGSVNRTSLRLDVTYDVKTLITVASGKVEMATLLRITNASGDGIDRLELNTIAARLDGLRITESTVDDAPVKVKVEGQTLVVPLGGILPDGASTAVRVGYRATLRPRLSGSDWMFSRAGGTLAMHRWIPWISRKTPFDRPNDGEPFVTPTSAKVDVEIVTDERMDLAAPADKIVEVPAGSGRAWAFSMENVRDVSVVLAPSFNVVKAQSAGVPIRVYTRPGSSNQARLLALARDAVRASSDQLDVDYPWPGLAVVETQGGESLETPALVWLPRTENALNRTYMVHHEIAQQWFSGLVGNNQQAEPFADEAMADLMARTTLGLLRPSRCPTARLDRALTAYSGNCYYETIFVQGGLVLDDIRSRMGSGRFWGAVRAYLENNAHGIGGTRQLLGALQEASDVNLEPLLRARFPALY